MLTRENTIVELKDSSVKEYSGIKFKELPFVNKLNIRGDSLDKTFISTIGKTLEVFLPIKANTYNYNGKIKILWLGPNEWLILNENIKDTDLISKLENVGNNEKSSITDVSENRTILRISGKKIMILLSKFLAINLDKNLQDETSVIQTIFVKVPIILIRNNNKEQEKIPEIDLLANRSHIGYIYQLLVDGTKNLDF